MKAFFMRFIRNKFFVLVIAVVVLSIVYYGVDKGFYGYSFDGNDVVGDDMDGEDSNVGVQFAEDEVDLVLEDFVDEMSLNAASGDGAEDESKIVDGGDVVLESWEEEKVVDGSSSAVAESIVEESGNKIYIYITGEVVVPGVVILDEGSRISDAINAAGGTTENANVSKVNLVYVLKDGMKVNIPNNFDLKNNPDFEYITTASGDGRNDVYASNSVSSSQSILNKVQEIVNINTATQTELESLPGIGPSLALKIINYRKENGSFSSIDDIKNVSGIGESKFEELKNCITV